MSVQFFAFFPLLFHCTCKEVGLSKFSSLFLTVTLSNFYHPGSTDQCGELFSDVLIQLWPYAGTMSKGLMSGAFAITPAPSPFAIVGLALIHAPPREQRIFFSLPFLQGGTQSPDRVIFISLLPGHQDFCPIKEKYKMHQAKFSSLCYSPPGPSQHHKGRLLRILSNLPCESWSDSQRKSQ